MAYAQPFPLAAPHDLPPAKPTYGPDLAVRLICRECQDPNPDIVEEFGSGDLVCGQCGLVLGDRVVDVRSEWRTFANDEGDDPSRVGAAIDPLMEGIEQLDTVISFRDGGSGIARELQRAASRSQNSRSERNILQAFREISNWCEQFSMPKTISDIAKQLYKRSEEEKLLRGKSVDAVIAACIFIACRQAKVPRTFREICQLVGVSKKALGQCYKALERAFNLTGGAGGAHGGANGGAHTGRDDRGSATVTTPEDLLVRYCSHLGLPQWMQSYCKDLIARARERGVADGRSPISIAGATLLFTTSLFDELKSTKEIGQVAGVSETTIKIVYKQLWDQQEDIIPKEWFEEGREHRADLEKLVKPNA